MRTRGLVAGIAVSSIVTGFLVSCGGGGGYGGMSNPMPTASFTSPASGTAISFGQALKLTWTSNYATSCTASTSSATAGAFSSSQALSGTVTVVPTAPGSVTYTLTCSGAGGMTVATSPMVTVNPSILSVLASSKVTIIGSTLDPTLKDGNPYGLALATKTGGLITAGDLIVCNFNDGATNTQGLGTTIVGLHPMAGAAPYRISQASSLKGCAALALLPDGSIAAAAYSANQTPLVTPAGGTPSTPFASDSFTGPWGEVFVAASGAQPAALYVADYSGAIDRIALNGDAQTSFTQIATGFCASGVPGSIYAPAGLTYDPTIDTLYIVDTSSFSVVAFANVSQIGAAGIVVNGQCKSVASPPTPVPTFSGPSASSARVIAHGSPLFSPIGATLLADGDVLVVNDDINLPVGQMGNLVVEVSPALPGGFVGSPLQLDSGAPGALFGILGTVNAGSQVVYFVDDNTNTLNMIATPAMGFMPYGANTSDPTTPACDMANRMYDMMGCRP